MVVESRQSGGTALHLLDDLLAQVRQTPDPLLHVVQTTDVPVPVRLVPGEHDLQQHIVLGWSVEVRQFFKSPAVEASEDADLGVDDDVLAHAAKGIGGNEKRPPVLSLEAVEPRVVPEVVPRS
jgi:hypothetical protein